MITLENLRDVIALLSSKDKNRIINQSWKYEYIVLYLHVFNVGCVVNCKITNDYNRYKNVSNDGNCILDLCEVVEIIKKIDSENKYNDSLELH